MCIAHTIKMTSYCELVFIIDPDLLYLPAKALGGTLVIPWFY